MDQVAPAPATFEPEESMGVLTLTEIKAGIAYYEGVLRELDLDAQARAVLRADIATLMQMRREELDRQAEQEPETGEMRVGRQRKDGNYAS